MKLNSVEIINYKSIKKLKVNMGSLTAIVGKNNFGKSTILDAIQCFYGEKEIQSDNFHMNTEEDIEIIITFDDITQMDIERCFAYKALKTRTLLKIKDEENGSRRQQQLEKLEATRKKKFEETLEKYRLQFPEKKQFTVKMKHTRNGKTTYYLHDGSTITKKELFKFLPPIKVITAIRTPEKETTAGAKTNLKELISLLQKENDTEDYIELPKTEKKLSYGEIKSLISKKEEEKCEFLSEDLTKNFQSALNTDSLSVKVKIDETFKFDFKYKTVIEDRDTPGKEVDILSCGTGLQSMLILSILQTYIKLKNDDDFILLIEEPEVYLHPSLQRKMIATLLQISKRNQIILTTHSPIIISKIDKENIHCVHKEKGVTTLVDSTLDTIISELGVQISDIFNKEAVLFVEGKDDVRLFGLLIDKIASYKGLDDNFSEKYLDIIQTDGFDKMSFYANAKILHKSAVKFPFWVITDSDGESVEERKKILMEKGKNNNLMLDKEKFKVLSEYAIESYFLDPKLLKRITNIDENDLQLLCDTYFQKYEENLNKLRSNKISKNYFQGNFKPKIMFSNLGKKEEDIKKILEKRYNADENIIRIRQSLLEKWNSYQDPIYTLIESTSYEELLDSKMRELLIILEEIVETISKNIPKVSIE